MNKQLSKNIFPKSSHYLTAKLDLISLKFSLKLHNRLTHKDVQWKQCSLYGDQRLFQRIWRRWSFPSVSWLVWTVTCEHHWSSHRSRMESRRSPKFFPSYSLLHVLNGDAFLPPVGNCELFVDWLEFTLHSFV